ncbi:MAG: hypothetical protein U9O95_07955 [Candidatus Marinimicrobia bacterium]|nr:hypothetical protein [Candidatus Neomarinimicrobiota bacterium]
MKRTIYIMIIFVLSIGLLNAEDVETGEDMINELGNLSIPIDHEHASFQPGFTLSPAHSLFPIAGVNIPFGGPYYISGGLGAGIDQNDQGELTLLYLGIGYYDRFPGMEDFFYSFNASVRSFQSIDYNSMILSGEFFVEQDIQGLRIGAGITLGIQDYTIGNTSIYPAADERTYMAIMRVFLHTRYGNIEIKGMPNSIIAGISWTLKLEE